MPSKNTSEDKPIADGKPALTPEELENLKNDQEATKMAEAIVKGLNEAALKNDPKS